MWLTHPVGDTINTMGDDGDFIWLGTRHQGLIKVRKSTGQLAAFSTAFGLPDPYIYHLQIDNDGVVWAGTKGGLVIVGGPQTVVLDSANSLLPHNDVRAVLLHQGEAWLGTHNGLVRIQEEGWIIYPEADTALADEVVRVLAAKDSVIWVGTQDGGLGRFANDQWSWFNDSNSDLTSNAIWSLAVDDDGTVWMGTPNGLFSFDGTDWMHFSTANSGIGSNWINSIEVDDEGHLWLATHHGMTHYDGMTFTNYTSTNSDLPGEIAEAILVDEQGDTWIGFFNGSLAAFNPNGVQNGRRGRITFKVFPVPFSGETQLEINNPNAFTGDYEVIFTGTNGQTLDFRQFTTNILPLSGLSLPAGAVIYTLYADGAVVGSGKFVVGNPPK